MEISKAYDPGVVEEKWYAFWLQNQFFKADENSAKPAYSIVIPPPNVTGMLHMGHVLNNTIQDILSRKARMTGHEVLWLPGTDHAGIATQMMVERQLKKEEKKSRHDLGREAFLEKVWAWKEKHGSIIINQLKKLGCSCDWSRERFTMDPEYSRCVQRVFVDLYRQDLIYKGRRMVNWCPVSQTALSDEEVEMKPQKGFLYHFKVRVLEMDDTWLTIATTRPETIPGDTAVAVNPKDTRYAHLIGKSVLRPFPADIPETARTIPIIGDEHVDFAFGTGVLKVTPAHDKADFEIARRHGLPFLEVIRADGTMDSSAGSALAGMDRFRARKEVVEALRSMGALTEEKPYDHNVGFSQRADVPIEPRLSEQWFLKYPALEASRLCVAEGRMRFHPDRWAKVYDHWLNNIQDWCISRQLWWGHRIPLWSKMLPAGQNLDGCLAEAIQQASDAGDLAVIKTIPQPDGQIRMELATNSEACSKLALMLGFEQDPDVLDTWFSSWLWPFATMGWPAKTGMLRKFYPTTDLVTGPDILFFWVARMIMAGYAFMGGKEQSLPDPMPFRNVYFTGIIRDKQGRKMSKTLGNSPDPLVLIEKYGADALRFGTMRSAPLGQDVLFDEKDVELGRNFCNKLWNACRFRQMQGGAIQDEIQPALLNSDDRWILSSLNTAIRSVTLALNEYQFSEASTALYRFFWSEYCDWYLEACKAVLNGDDAARKGNSCAVMDFILSHVLRLFHPFLPFITEELWHGMGYSADMPSNQGGASIMSAPWPLPLNEDEMEQFGLSQTAFDLTSSKYQLITQGRNLRRIGNIPSGKKVKYVFKPVLALDAHDHEVIRLLLNAESLPVQPDFAPPKGTPSVKTNWGELFLPLEGHIDKTAEKARLQLELGKIEAEILKVKLKLENPGFVQKVPPQVLQEHQQRLVDWQAKMKHVQESIDALED